MNELEQYISGFFGMENTDLPAITHFFKHTALARGEYYLKAGQVCNSLSFQRSGHTRFYKDAGEKEITQWISAKGGFVCDLSGLIFRQPGRYHIQALTDCDFYTIDIEDYLRIGTVIPQWHQLEKLFIARCFIFMEERIFSLLSMKAEERYRWLFDHYPDLFNQVPLQYLASMISMTPETLSRIRSNNLRQNS